MANSPPASPTQQAPVSPTQQAPATSTQQAPVTSTQQAPASLTQQPPVSVSPQNLHSMSPFMTSAELSSPDALKGTGLMPPPSCFDLSLMQIICIRINTLTHIEMPLALVKYILYNYH